MADTRRIVLTGAGRGLGLAMTEGFIERGHTVIGCGRSQETMQELAKRFGRPHQFDAVDVADEKQVKRWAESVLVDGPPDLLLNNAAIINRSQPLWEVPTADFSQVIDVNIKGVFHVLRHFVPAMVDRQQGIVVNFSSGWGRSTSPEVASYCATKYAIEGLTLALSAELPQGMAAIPLNPGIINTQMLESAFGAAAADYQAPDEWAETAVPFLLALRPKDNGRSLTVK
ncbi:MAG: SDR family oxidoreductase [Planctomycetales bacterium]|nr:SDR family oxidoreductase [Planctomycetales bacterium]